jgi:hypothetical protein
MTCCSGANSTLHDDGFLTLRLSPVVGQTGHVFAVDIAGVKLQRLNLRAEEAHFGNIEIVNGDESDPRLPLSTLVNEKAASSICISVSILLLLA